MGRVCIVRKRVCVRALARVVLVDMCLQSACKSAKVFGSECVRVLVFLIETDVDIFFGLR